ncbi:unnamed protein product [Didymodactylos carnosus]|uniref:VWFA domain-containing protein n=1 Tax=Didymodactylos carnosus TaxID=1234261 RepID=A0A814JDB8_9BILA|nr:unnamed protein product [Didymodactylos carnosus]CAF1035930.1 unnamed protein product [Didymodactylos carnosus]CAF3529983.1 unnamed protein product [Didymodactylos carnosus]CAF3806507.1 unnamed protein product [Didymodactylos carnosus]
MSSPYLVIYPENFLCPITHSVMCDPVMDLDGNNYERCAINDWLSINPTSPVTQNPLSIGDLTPNETLREAIEQFRNSSNIQKINVKAEQMNVGEGRLASDVDLRVDVTYSNNYAHISVQPPTGIERTPCDICCVVDTSGSMQDEVEMKNKQNAVEKYGLSQLDIVKHALKTIIHSLREADRLSVVSFSERAATVFQLLKMDNEGKTTALTTIENLTPNGSTNLWDGLKTGLQILSEGSSDKSNSALFLLTDGAPTVIPPIGHIPALKLYKEQTGFSCVINTFGFGYKLDSKLLEEIAVIGNGKQ